MTPWMNESDERGSVIAWLLPPHYPLLGKALLVALYGMWAYAVVLLVTDLLGGK